MTIEIIAEIGVNHDGDFNKAVELVHEAKRAGANTVKFQLFSADRVYGPEEAKELRRLELSRVEIAEIKGMCGKIGMGFLCTPDDVHDARFLRDLHVQRIKIGSSNVTNSVLLQEIASYGLPVLLSTGASTLQEVVRAASHFRPDMRTIMHCTSAYPAPIDDLNLAMIKTLRRRFSAAAIGFSDHANPSYGAKPASLALALGARVFEKHLTLHHESNGPDHASSLEPDEFKTYVGWLHMAERMISDGEKRIMESEKENRARYVEFVARQGSGRC